MSLAEIVALIPARAGSKGVRDKNVRRLGRLPLSVWTIAACQRSSEIDRVIMSTEAVRELDDEYRRRLVESGRTSNLMLIAGHGS